MEGGVSDPETALQVLSLASHPNMASVIGGEIVGNGQGYGRMPLSRFFLACQKWLVEGADENAFLVQIKNFLDSMSTCAITKDGQVFLMWFAKLCGAYYGYMPGLIFDADAFRRSIDHTVTHFVAHGSCLYDEEFQMPQCLHVFAASRARIQSGKTVWTPQTVAVKSVVPQIVMTDYGHSLKYNIALLPTKPDSQVVATIYGFKLSLLKGKYEIALQTHSCGHARYQFAYCECLAPMDPASHDYVRLVAFFNFNVGQRYLTAHLPPSLFFGDDTEDAIATRVNAVWVVFVNSGVVTMWDAGRTTSMTERFQMWYLHFATVIPQYRRLLSTLVFFSAGLADLINQIEGTFYPDPVVSQLRAMVLIYGDDLVVQIRSKFLDNLHK